MKKVKIVRGSTEVTLRRVKEAVTPQKPGFMLKSPHSSVVPISAKKYNTLQKMLPHMPLEHHELYKNLPHEDNSASSSQPTHNDRRQRGPETAPRGLSATRKQRIDADDRFISKFDEFFPLSARTALENASSYWTHLTRLFL